MTPSKTADVHPAHGLQCRLAAWQLAQSGKLPNLISDEVRRQCVAMIPNDLSWRSPPGQLWTTSDGSSVFTIVGAAKRFGQLGRLGRLHSLKRKGRQ